MKNFLFSLRCAGRGIYLVLSSERNFRIQLLVFVLVVIAAVTLNVTQQDFVVLLLISAVIFSLELINSAIERLADKISPQYDQQIGVVKDMMAGAVLLASIFASVIGLIIFYAPLLKVLQQ